ncbi:hypothetical protein [Prevotella intermedia]|nr:hypothetical protein [Prevotella intermedia]
MGNSREVPCMQPFLHFNATSYLPYRGGKPSVQIARSRLSMLQM